MHIFEHKTYADDNERIVHAKIPLDDEPPRFFGVGHVPAGTDEFGQFEFVIPAIRLKGRSGITMTRWQLEPPKRRSRLRQRKRKSGASRRLFRLHTCPGGSGDLPESHRRHDVVPRLANHFDGLPITLSA